MDFLSLLGRVPHVRVRVDRVAVASSVPFALDVAGFDEVGEDSLGGALGDADLVGDVSHPDVGAAGDAEENLGVVGEESPAAGGLLITRHIRR